MEGAARGTPSRGLSTRNIRAAAFAMRGCAKAKRSARQGRIDRQGHGDGFEDEACHQARASTNPRDKPAQYNIFALHQSCAQACGTCHMRWPETRALPPLERAGPCKGSCAWTGRAAESEEEGSLPHGAAGRDVPRLSLGGDIRARGNSLSAGPNQSSSHMPP